MVLDFINGEILWFAFSSIISSIQPESILCSFSMKRELCFAETKKSIAIGLILCNLLLDVITFFL